MRKISTVVMTMPKNPIRLSLPIDYLVKVVASVKSEVVGLQLNLVPEEGEDVACNNILVEDDDALYCLTQLVAEYKELRPSFKP